MLRNSLKKGMGFQMIFPKRLKKGDLVGVIAPAGPPNMTDLNRGLLMFQQLGLQVRLGKHIDSIYGYLAGRDQERLSDFHEMVQDPEIKGIFFAKGGYGTGRFAAQIDYDLIRKNPKVIWGYSDITYLHTAIRKKSHLVTFHGPMIESDLSESDIKDETLHMFQQVFAKTCVFYSEQIAPLKVLVEGEATGELVGGNLSLLISTLGTPFEIDVTGKILLIEDVKEEPYRVDGMLNQLAQSGKLSDVAGVMIGDFAKSVPTRDPSLSLEEVFGHYFNELDCPVMQGFKIGHCSPHIAVPLGVQAKMDTKRKTVMIEPGVV